MAQLDDRILEYIAEESWSSPAIIARSGEFSASEARLAERCRMLVYDGLLAPIHAEMYELTTWGELYLRGEIDALHQPVPTVDRLKHR